MRAFAKLFRRAYQGPHFSSSVSQSRGLSERESYFGGDKTGLKLIIPNKAGSLANILNVISHSDLNLSFIESYPQLVNSGADSIVVELEIEAKAKNLRNVLSKLETLVNVEIMQPPTIPWFPSSLQQLGEVGKKILVRNEEQVEYDDPYFRDEVYRNRRQEISRISLAHEFPDQEIPVIKYTEEEINTWNYCFERLCEATHEHGCEAYRACLDDLNKNCGFKIGQIPQLRDLSAYIYNRTGWRFRPVGGLLSQRMFLNGLALRVFHSTQYIRHPSQPLFTPEPDVVHELIGHAPMFLYKDYANLSQEIGIASLGASDAVLSKLAAIYFHLIEMGICWEKGQPRIYGAALLSSIAETEKALKLKETFQPLDCHVIEKTNYEIFDQQSSYFISKSLEEAYKAIKEYTGELKKPFRAFFDQDTEEIKVDRRIILERDQ